MPDNQQEPTFNLKVVVRETGLRPDTLRAWERRYGLPQPARSSGGHRLYTQRDIDILKWLVARQHEGMTISRAVKLWFQLIESGHDPVRSLEVGSKQPDLALSSTNGSVVENFRKAWVSASLDFNETGAEQVLNQAFTLYPPEVVVLELLLKGIVDIGDKWYRGEATVQHEHFASELAVRRLEAMIMGSPPPHHSGRILLACPPAEHHVLGPLMLNLFLRRRGWDVLYLGANVPPQRLQATVEVVKPRLVILSAQQLSTASGLLQLGELLVDIQTPMAYGGLVFNRIPRLRAFMPAYFLGEKIEQAVPAIEEWLMASARLEAKEANKKVSRFYKTALTHYLTRQKVIEIEVWHLLQESGLYSDELQSSYAYLAASIAAALRLGDINFLNEDIVWAEKLLYHRDIPRHSLTRLLEIYHQAAKTHLDEQGQIVVDWLSTAGNLVGQQTS